MQYKWTILGIVLNTILFAVGLHLGRFQLRIALWTYGIPIPIAVIGKIFVCRFEGCNRKFDNARSRASHENFHNEKYKKRHSEMFGIRIKKFWNNPVTRAIGCANNAIRTPARIKACERWQLAGNEASRGLKRTPEHIAKLVVGIIVSNIRRGIEYRRKYPIRPFERFFIDEVLNGDKYNGWTEYTGLVEQTVYNEYGEPVLPYNHI